MMRFTKACFAGVYEDGCCFQQWYGTVEDMISGGKDDCYVVVCAALSNKINNYGCIFVNPGSVFFPVETRGSD
jgi:hypothetical protein